MPCNRGGIFSMSVYKARVKNSAAEKGKMQRNFFNTMRGIFLRDSIIPTELNNSMFFYRIRTISSPKNVVPGETLSQL